MNTPLQLARRGIDAIDLLGLWIGLLSLRLILAWEFGEAGFENCMAATGLPTSRTSFLGLST
jgi:hypothetical protein